MAQHDFNIANQLFPATRADLNSSLVALATNSSGATEPTTTFANQWWYETDTHILKLRKEANNGWIDIATLDQTNSNVLSITTQGLNLGGVALTATGTEINQLAGITRGSILYGNASGATARLAKGSADTVLTSDGTDISWAVSSSGGLTATAAPSWASPSSTSTSSGTWSKPAGLADSALVWVYGVGGGQGGGTSSSSGGSNASANGGYGGNAFIVQVTAGVLAGKSYVIGSGGAGKSGGTTAPHGNFGGATTLTISGTVYTTGQAGSGGVQGQTSGYSNIAGNEGINDANSSANYHVVTYPVHFVESISPLSSIIPSGVPAALLPDAVFAGGSGSVMAWDSSGGPAGQDSTFAGDAGDSPGNGAGSGQAARQQGSVGSIPGGGGSPTMGNHPNWGNTASLASMAGGAGNIRFYHS